MPRAPSPLLVLGLDGASHSVLKPLAGQLPNIRALMESGASGVATSTSPPVTFPAWTSVLTGCDPEVHGIRELLTREHVDAPLRPVSGADRRAPLIAESLAQRGYRVACLGVPGLYPPPRASGLWVAGFDAPGADRATRHSVYPPALYRELESLGAWRYAIFNEQRVDLESAVDALIADIDEKTVIMQRLQRRCDWDLFFVHLQAADTACHHLWPTWDRNSPRAHAFPCSDALPRVFRALDQSIGRLVERHAGRVMLISDHGFGGASDIAVYINRALADAGLLRFSAANHLRTAKARCVRMATETLPTQWLGRLVQSLPSSVTGHAISQMRQPNIDRAHSVAFSDELDHSPSIWFRRALTSHEHDRLERVLLELRAPGTNETVIESLQWRKGLGAGPALYLIPRWVEGYRPSFLPSVGPGPAVDLMTDSELRGGRGAGMSGVHHPDGVIALSGPDVPQQTVTCSLSEAGASIPALMGVALDEVAGRSPPALAHAVGIATEAYAASSAPSAPRAPGVSSAAAARLRALGYL